MKKENNVHLKLLYNGRVKNLSDLTKSEIDEGIMICRDLIDKLKEARKK